MADPISPQFLFQFVHPEKLLAVLPGADAIGPTELSRLYGISARELEGLEEGFADAVGAAAKRLADKPDAPDFPFVDGEVVVCLGDSITDDRQSWARMLAHLANDRKDRRVDVVELAVSGDARERTFQGAEEGCLVPDTATAKNLSDLRALAMAETDAELVWITPPPAIDEWVAGDDLFAAQRMVYSSETIAAKADLIRAMPDLVVDVAAVFGNPADPDLFLSDGLHPSVAGQELILKALLARLAEQRA